MNFGFSDEQDLLREEMRRFLVAQAPMEEVRRLMETPEGYSPQLWRRLGELGYLGLALPEEVGGAGLGWVDLVVLLEETGRALFPSPLISTALAGSLILDAGSQAQKRRWLPAIADGSRIGTLALLEASDLLAPRGVVLRGAPDGDGFVLEGEKSFVVDAGGADLLVAAFRTGDGEQELSLAVVEAGASALSVTELPTLDRSKRVGSVRFEGLRVPPEAVLGPPGAAWPAIARAIDRGAVAVTAEMVGAAEAALELTVQFAKDRIQFGSPIGHFQGVKHPLAEMYVDIESLKSLLYHAAWALDAQPEKAALAVSEAKAFGSLAFSRLGVECVQLHGAVGYTLEYDIQLYLKRSKWSRPMFGDEDYHCDRIAQLQGY